MQHIKLFDSLRGIMALWVVLIHTMQTVDIYTPKSISKVFNVAYAVDVFIILSGFVIFLLLDNSRKNYSSFIIRRGFRLFPVYLVALVISAITIDFQVALWQGLEFSGHYWVGRLQTLQDSTTYFNENLIPHLFLLQGLLGGVIPSSDFAFIEPAWSLSLEWQFYLLAPLIFLLVMHTKNSLYVLLLSFCIALLYGQAGSGFLPNQIHFFIVGMVSYFIYKQALVQPDSRLAVLMLCTSLLLRDIPLTIWSACLCLAIYQNNPVCFVRSILENKVFQYIGKISYPIYVIHTLMVYPVIILLGIFSFELSTMQSKLLFIALTFLLTILFSQFLHTLIEKPGMKLGKNLALRFNKKR